VLALAGIAALARAQGEPIAQGALLAPIRTAVFPTARPLAITIAPPASPLAIIAAANFPRAAPLAVTVLPAPSPLALINAATFPVAQPLAVTIERGEILQLATTVTGVVTPSVSSGPPSPEALAAIANADFPTPQPLSVTLVPPATPLSAIAAANLPAPQPLAVTLVPPATPLAAIAAAKFPDPQPLSVTLYAGEALQAAATFAGIAPPLTLGPAQIKVQIVQVIPRRGVNFFDARDPAGLGTVLVAGTPAPGGGTPTAPPTSGTDIWICDTVVWTDGLGVPYMNATPPPVPAMRITGGSGVNATVTLLPPWDPVPGTNPTVSGGTFVFAGDIGSAQLAAGCPGANPGDNLWNQRLRTVEEGTLAPLPHVCVRRNATDLFPGAGCNANGI
jgi:hypothetical protein